MTTYIFKGKLTTEEPLTVSLPGRSNNKISYLPRNGNQYNGDPRPYFPASSIRGALRHAAHYVALRFTQEKTGEDKPFDLNEHFMLAQGVDSGEILSNEKTIGVVDFGSQVRQKNPLLSLFGRWQLESHAAIGNAFPVQKECWGLFGGGTRGVVFENDPSLFETLDAEDQSRFERIMLDMADYSVKNNALKEREAELKKQLKTASADEKKDIQAELNAIDAERKTLKENKEGPENSIRRPLDAYEAFSAGAELSHKIILRKSNPVELGLFLDALAEFARDPRLGGHKAFNNGLIRMDYEVFVWPDDADESQSIGEIHLSNEGFKVTGEPLITARKTWRDADIDFKVLC